MIGPKGDGHENCAAHRGLVAAIRGGSGMRRAESIAIAGVLCLAAVADVRAQDWTVAARACYADTGPAGAAYRATFKDHDQYDSILACETAAGEYNARPEPAWRTAIKSTPS